MNRRVAGASQTARILASTRVDESTYRTTIKDFTCRMMIKDSTYRTTIKDSICRMMIKDSIGREKAPFQSHEVLEGRPRSVRARL